MAAVKVWGFNEDGFNRVVEATRIVLRTPTTGARRRRQPPVISSGGGGGCDQQNARVQMIIMGKPTGGTFPVMWTVNSVSTSLTFNWNDSAAAIKTVLETHSEIASGDVTVTGGPFPNTTVEVEFTGLLANTDVRPPYGAWGSLTGGTGVAVICVLAQKGHA